MYVLPVSFLPSPGMVGTAPNSQASKGSLICTTFKFFTLGPTKGVSLSSVRRLRLMYYAKIQILTLFLSIVLYYYYYYPVYPVLSQY